LGKNLTRFRWHERHSRVDNPDLPYSLAGLTPKRHGKMTWFRVCPYVEMDGAEIEQRRLLLLTGSEGRESGLSVTCEGFAFCATNEQKLALTD